MLEKKFVDPLLTAKNIAENIAPALTAEEERLAFLHISIDLIEHDNSQNMTKAAYESLVLAVLHGSSHDSAVGRHAIYERLGCLVRDVSSVVLNARIDSALERLSAKHGQLKHIRGTDSFHIAHEESGRIQRGTEIFLEEENSLKQDILAALYLVDSEIVDDDARRDDCVQAIKEIIEKLLLDYGEQFSRAISTGRIPETEKGTLEHLLTEMAFKTHLPNTEAAKVIHLVLAYAADSTQEHLLRLLDSYTVLALLKSTPDVQKALRKVFAGETIWLGTSVILPLMAECLSAGSTPMRDLIKACHLSDIKLRVTSGVIEEVDAHLNVCVAGARSTSTSSFRLPFLLSEYLLSGRSRTPFVDWQEEFRGGERPALDIEEYLADEFRVKRADLQEQVDAAPEALKLAAGAYWHEVQQRRRRKSGIDALDLDRLIAHDVENTVGIIQLRGRANPGPAGYQQWWLTMDRSARGLSAHLESEAGERVPSPVIDPAYLVQLLRFY